MSLLTIGNPSRFAIESSITEPYVSLGQRALGFFVIYVRDKCYGVRSPEATLLACSFDEVKRRISRRGTHCVQFDSEIDAADIVDAIRAVLYGEPKETELVLGMTPHELHDVLVSKKIVWAPDGDAAFDDGGHVLHFDMGNRVRLIAFKNADNEEEVKNSLSDVWIDAVDFYGILEEWQNKFESEWSSSLKQQTRH